MVLGLHVKNLALIEKAEVEFTGGLNILTGETGAGKSILIGSVGLALGGKASKDMIRQGEDSALVELAFSVDDEKKKNALEALDIAPDEDGLLIISKKITPSRTVSRINDETVTTARLKAVTGLLLDIHGQHEHQSLLHKQKHLEILDEYSRNETENLKRDVEEGYRKYQALREKLSGFHLDEETRKRESDFLRFEIQEIENAAIRPGEEEELSAVCRKFSHSRKIAEAMQTAFMAVDGADLGRAVKHVENAAAYDENLNDILKELSDAEDILNGVARSISDYMNEMEFDEETFKQTEERLDRIRSLMAKYGNSEEAVLKSLEEKRERLQELENYEELAALASRSLKPRPGPWSSFAGPFGGQKACGPGPGGTDRGRAHGLEFPPCGFRIDVRDLEHFTAQGADEVEFMISTNPGSIPPRPLGEVASGGELSRIMLAIKTVLADTDDIPTLIFDEIDTGISGRTAQKVSERLSYIAGKHQVLCITHLPQIAAMADTHFEIRKTVENGKTSTRIHKLGKEEQTEELARLLGGAEITGAVLENAREMKRLAEKKKRELLEERNVI
ncbi:MAG: DNA repair protein RecN [Enterocloster sp.]